MCMQCDDLRFSLPAIGRTSNVSGPVGQCDTYEPSPYGANTIVLDGNSNDSVVFGPQQCCTSGLESF